MSCSKELFPYNYNTVDQILLWSREEDFIKITILGFSSFSDTLLDFL